MYVFRSLGNFFCCVIVLVERAFFRLFGYLPYIIIINTQASPQKFHTPDTSLQSRGYSEQGVRPESSTVMIFGWRDVGDVGGLILV